MTLQCFLLLATLSAKTALAEYCEVDQTLLGIDSDIRANAGCIIVKEGKLLVIQSPLGKVSIPGGSAHKGEVAACTAARETQEETGLKVSPIKLAKIWENGFYLFECNATAGKIDTSISQAIEVRAIHWLAADEFDSYQWRYKKQKDWLKSYLKPVKQKK